MAARRIAVIGAGPAGLAAADRLCRRGADVRVLEREERVGGLARTFDLWGERVDLGTHIVSGGDDAGLALASELLGKETRTLPLRRGMLLDGRVLDYPPRPLQLARHLGVRESAAAAIDVLEARLRKGGTTTPSAEEWLTGRYGRRLYDTVARAYIEKLWGRPGREVDASFVRPLDAARQPEADSFRYPMGGIATLTDALAARVTSGGGTICTGVSVDRFVTSGNAVRGVVVGGRELEVHAVVSTMPLGALARHLAVASDQPPIETRHVMVAHLALRSVASPPLPWLWVFVADQSLAVGRVSDLRSWKRANARTTITTMEYWCGPNDAHWRESDDEFLARAERELRETGLFAGASIEGGRATRLPGVLPVPSVGVRERVATLTRAVEGIRGVVTVGRHGSFETDSVISAMGAGIRAADRAFDAQS